MNLLIVICKKDISNSPLNMEFFHLHLVTWTACLAKPARFHTRLPSLGIKLGTSLLTSLYDTGFLLYALSLLVLDISQLLLVAPL